MRQIWKQEGRLEDMENGMDKSKASGSSVAATPTDADGQSPSPAKALQVTFEDEQGSQLQTYHAVFTLHPGLADLRIGERRLSLQGIQGQLDSLQLDQQGNNPKKSYAFWETQPVAQFNEAPGSSASVAVRHGT